MANLVKPELSELKYRQKLHENSLSMAYRGGTELFPKEAWAEFYQNHVEADPQKSMYRLIFCPNCNAFTGEVSWEYNEDKKRYEMQILIQYSMRRQGYGRKGINLIKKLARENGIGRLYAPVARSNEAVSFFEHLGLEKVSEDENTVTFSL